MTQPLAKTPFYSRNIAGSTLVVDERFILGTVFWVDSVTGTDSLGNGRTPEAPFATIAYAFSSDVLTADSGDVVIVLPAHAETVDGAADIACDIAGVKVLGLGEGYRRPTITFATATAADIDIDAAGVTIENIKFLNTIADLKAPIDVNAAGFRMVNCEWRDDASDPSLTVIQGVAAADDCQIIGCTFHQPDAGAASCISLIGSDRWLIADNVMIGDWSDAAINDATTASTNIVIRGNRITNLQSGACACIELDGGTSTGLCVDNHLLGCDGNTTLAAALVPNGLDCHANYATHTTALSGQITPAAETAD